MSKAPAGPRAARTPGQSLEAAPTDVLTARSPLQSGSRLALYPACSEQHGSAPPHFISSLPQRWKSFYLPFAPLRSISLKKKKKTVGHTHTHVHTLINEKNWRNKDVMDRLYQFPDWGLTHLLETQNTVLGGKAMLGVHWISLSYSLPPRVNVQ